ncbi:Tfp pilus assembly protein FimT/FimU [Patescibacteria group bacterium]
MYQTKRGFTLLEVLVVTAIILIMTVSILATLNSNKLDRELESAGDQTYSAIREAQNYALTGKETAPGCDVYSFSFSDDRYIISNKESDGTECAFRTVGELKNSVQFAGSGSIDFSVPHGDVNVETVESIGLSKSGKTYNVCVYNVGAVTRTRTSCSSTPQ